MSAETKSPEDYRSALEADELDKLTKGLAGLSVSNEKPLMTTYPTTKPGATTQGKTTTKGKSAKARTVNVQAATRKLAEEKGKTGREARQTKKRATATVATVASPPKAASLKEANLEKVLAAIPEGTRRTRAQTRKVLEKVPLAQRKGAKTHKKKISKTLEQRARERRAAKISMKRFGNYKTTQALKKEERSRKAKETAAKAAATRAEKEEKKKQALAKAAATRASKKDETME
jgi:hypothetical protein